MSDALNLGSAWLTSMGPAALRAALILLLTWTLVLVLRTQAARLRSFIWTSGIILALLAPMMLYQPVTFGVDLPFAASFQRAAPQAPAAYLPEIVAAPRQDAGAKAPQGTGPNPGQAAQAKPVDAQLGGAQSRPAKRVEAAETLIQPGETATPPSARSVSSWLPGALGLVWLGGTLLLLARFAAGLYRQALRSQHLRTIADGPWFHDAKRIAGELGLLREVRLVLGEAGSSPQTWGILHPTIAIPAGDEMPDDESRQAILRHELAHIARFDAVRLTIERLVTALLWWNPLAWLVTRRAQLDREQACDDAVLLRGAQPSAYATQLLIQACGLPRSQVEAEGVSLLSREVDGQLVRRVGRILDPHARRTRPSAVILAGLTLALILLSSSVSAFAVTVENAGGDDARGNVAEDVNINVEGDRTEIILYGDAGDLTANITGNVKFGEQGVVKSITPGGSFTLADERAIPERGITFTPSDSAVATTYRVDGVEQDFDQAGRTWLEAALLDLFRQTGLDAGRRVNQILLAEGAAGILAEVELLPSDAVRVTYLGFALRHHITTDADRTLLLENLGETVESEVERSRLITSLETGRLAANPKVRDATFVAIASLHRTPGEQRRALEHMLPAAADDEANLVMALDLAAGLENDDELGQFLTVSAPFVPGTESAALAAWLSASQGLRGDVERGQVMRAMLRRSDATAAFSIQVIESAAEIESDAEKAQLLIDVVSHFRGANETRAAYQAVAETIGSEYERSRALAAL